MGKWLAFIALAIVALVGWRAYIFLDKSGSFRQTAYGPPPECQAAPGVDGVQGLVVDPTTGNVYVSNFDRRSLAGDKSARGAISVFSLRMRDEFPDYYTESENGGRRESSARREAFGPAPLEQKGPATSETGTSKPETSFPGSIVQDARDLTDAKSLPAFAPQSISFYVYGAEKREVAVVNHADGEAVELFDIDRGYFAGCKPDLPQLTHRRTVKSPLFHDLKGVVLVGPDQFYVTNAHRFSNGAAQLVEDVLMAPTANVVYFDGASARVAVSGLTYANGIDASWNHKLIYVAETTPHILRTFERDKQTGNLTLARAPWGRFDAGTPITSVANVYGALYLGAQPEFLAYLRHLDGGSHPSPSAVVRLNGGPSGWERVSAFLDDGKRISDVSGASGSGDILLLGSTFGRELLVCRQPGYERLAPPPPPAVAYPVPKECAPPEVQVEMAPRRK